MLHFDILVPSCKLQKTFALIFQAFCTRYFFLPVSALFYQRVSWCSSPMSYILLSCLGALFQDWSILADSPRPGPGTASCFVGPSTQALLPRPFCAGRIGSHPKPRDFSISMSCLLIQCIPTSSIKINLFSTRQKWKFKDLCHMELFTIQFFKNAKKQQNDHFSSCLHPDCHGMHNPLIQAHQSL